jgi:hypothetical protein
LPVGTAGGLSFLGRLRPRFVPENSVRDGLPQAVRRTFGTVGPGSLSKEKKKEKINREERLHEGMRIKDTTEKKKRDFNIDTTKESPPVNWCINNPRNANFGILSFIFLLV